MNTELTAEKTTQVKDQLNPSKIMQVGMGFWASKALLTAVHFELFTLLGPGPLSAQDIKEKLSSKASIRHIYDWLDTLLSLGFLERKGLLDQAVYSNAEDTDFFLDKKKPGYMGGILEMANNRLYKHWMNLDEALLTGQQQNETRDDPHGNMDFFAKLYQDPGKLQEFMNAMSGIQTGNFIALSNKFNFDNYSRLLDVGGADGWLSIQVCLHHTDIQCTTFDLPPIEQLAKKKIESYGLKDRIQFMAGDFFKDDLPKADIIVMGNILHGMNEDGKQELLDKVYRTLPEGGVFMAVENIIDNERKQNTFGLLMSLNMLIENGDAFDYTMDDFKNWTSRAGFIRTEILPLTGPTSAAIAYK
jgi:SAM-dependent methyltransferase